MSVAVLISVHDGLVLAADSASTLAMTLPPGAPANAMAVANVYDNANKIFNIVKGQPLGCVTFGSGNIGAASIGTLIKDLRKELTETPAKWKFDATNYQIKDVAGILAKFLGDECRKLDNVTKLNTNIGFLVGGYSKPGSLGESWSLEILKGEAQEPRQLRKPDEPGISWGGSGGDVLQRIVIGYAPGLFPLLARVTNPPQNPADMQKQLGPILAPLQANIVFAPMPIQDAIDLARFLVHSAIMYARFLPGPNVVGGPIEIAAITKHENFKWIARKHYYDQTFNREPVHVIVD